MWKKHRREYNSLLRHTGKKSYECILFPGTVHGLFQTHNYPKRQHFHFQFTEEETKDQEW